jgi:hypothetical protein
VWLLTYDFGRRPFQALVNGYTGVVAGEYPKSSWKIAMIVLAVLAVVVTIVIVSRG